MRKCEDGVLIVSECEKMLQNRRKSIIKITSKQAIEIQKKIEQKKFVEMLQQLGISKSTIICKINLYKLIIKYPRI